MKQRHFSEEVKYFNQQEETLPTNCKVSATQRGPWPPHS